MKICKFFIELFVVLYYELVRWIKEVLTKLRYQKELGGKKGMRVTGIWRYPGRFQSKVQIIELCLNLEHNQILTVDVRWKKT